jgi:hypothetical protein
MMALVCMSGSICSFISFCSLPFDYEMRPSSDFMDSDTNLMAAAINLFAKMVESWQSAGVNMK